jgi:hypothetical protein
VDNIIKENRPGIVKNRFHPTVSNQPIRIRRGGLLLGIRFTWEAVPTGTNSTGKTPKTKNNHHGYNRRSNQLNDQLRGR